MAEIRVNPTRMEMKKLSARLTTARRGHKLLKDKRDELMKKFLDTVRLNKELREQVESKLAEVHASLSIASSVTSRKMMTEALMIPGRQGTLKVSYRSAMNVKLPVYDFDMGGGGKSGCNYGFAFTSGELDSAVAELAELLPSLVRLAELEKSAQMLAEEIEKTRRRVNALEYIMIPQYERGIASIRMKLDENERSNTVRLMKVKDMAVKREIDAAKKRDA